MGAQAPVPGGFDRFRCRVIRRHVNPSSKAKSAETFLACPELSPSMTALVGGNGFCLPNPIPPSHNPEWTNSPFPRSGSYS